MKPKRFTPVTFTEGGKEYTAIVLSARSLDEITGPDGDSLVHLAFFKPPVGYGPDGSEVEKDVVGTGDVLNLVQIRYDVAAESQDFSKMELTKDQLQNLALTYGGVKVRDKDGNETFRVTYPGGRWKASDGTEEEEEAEAGPHPGEEAYADNPTGNAEHAEVE